MKLSKLYIMLIWSIVTITTINSCTEILDMAPDGYISIPEIFQDNNKTGAYLNSCYEYIPEMGVKFHSWSRGLVNWSDEAWDSDEVAGLISGQLYQGNASAASHPIVNISASGGNGDYWTRYWSGIRKCAVFLSYIDNANVTNYEDKKRWKAEAHLLRAFYYSELLRWYGTGLPIIREAYSLDTDFGKIEKPSFYKTVKFVLEDCDAALNIEELPWRITTNAEAGRVNKAMAEAIKSRMILYAASPLYNEGQNYWNEAYSINKKSLENLKTNNYKLYNKINYPDIYRHENAHFSNEYSALYNEYFTQKMEYSSNPVDLETIYQNKTDQGALFNVDGIGINGDKTGTCPSQELVDSYETVNGETVLDLSKPYLDDETHLSPNYNMSNNIYDSSNPYNNRDPRLDGSIYYNGSKRTCYWKIPEDPKCYENYPAKAGNRTRIIATYPEEPYTGLNQNSSGTRSGYFQRKFLHPYAALGYPSVGANFKMFRLAEVILNFAEAAAENGQLYEAIAAINEIRDRVNMPRLSQTIGKEELILRIRNERRVELALEGFRYYDVRRWSNPNEDLSTTDRYLTAMRVKRHVDGNNQFTHYSYSRQIIGERMCYFNRYLRLPLPLNEANIMEKLTGEKWQNPGW